MRRSLLVLATWAGLTVAGASQANELMWVSETKADTYFLDLDTIQGEKDYPNFRSISVYRFTDVERAQKEGYDYTNAIMGVDCSKPGSVALLQVVAYNAQGAEVARETSSENPVEWDWFEAPAYTHMGLTWNAVCKNARSGDRRSDKDLPALLREVRERQSKALPSRLPSL